MLADGSADEWVGSVQLFSNGGGELQPVATAIHTMHYPG